jgi:hypothetical protein
LTKIAQEFGMSRCAISRDFNNPETQDYLRAQLAKHDARLDALVDKSLTAIDEGLTALRDDAADHGARMRAVERTTKLLELRAGRSDGDSGTSNKRWAGEFIELLAIYREIRTEGE